MIKVLVADDHQMFIDGVKSLLTDAEGIEVVAEAQNGLEVMNELEKHTVDIVLLDVNMPVMDGFEACKKIQHKYPDIKVLMLTMYNTKQYISNLLTIGAAGYILKNTGKKELMKAILDVSEGKSFFSQEVTQTIMQGMLRTDEHHQIEELKVPLSQREKDVLKLIAMEYTAIEIAEKLCISQHTVDTHRKNLIGKLNVRNVAGLVRYALQLGLIE